MKPGLISLDAPLDHGYPIWSPWHPLNEPKRNHPASTGENTEATMSSNTQAEKLVRRFLGAGLKEVAVTGGKRHDYVDQVWDMYKKSYTEIGLSVSSPSGLMKYDVWVLFLDGEGRAVAFNLFKKTSLGLKTGLLGSDGSPAAKSEIKSYIKRRYNRPGVYGEVSHAVERLSQGAPVVCAVHVPSVLGKPVTPKPDGVHYARNLKGVGLVTKKLVGTPRGVPSGPEGSCPAPTSSDAISPRMAIESDDELDLADHYASQLDFE